MPETYQDGRCKTFSIRVKTWKTGYSFKCTGYYKTILCRPYNETQMKGDLAVFCNDCNRQTAKSCVQKDAK